MPRLGRQRRSGAKYLRGKSVVTPTPLVRNRVVVHNARKTFLKRRWSNNAIILRSNISTPTQFTVRNRVVVVQQRKSKLIRATKRHPTIYIKPNVVVVVAAPTTVKPSIVIHKRRPALRRHHQAIILRAPSVPAPIPKPKQPLVHIRRHANRRSQINYLRPAGLSTQNPKPKQPIVHLRKRVVRRSQLSYLRAPSAILVVPYTRPFIQVHARRHKFARRHPTIILGSVRGSVGVVLPPSTTSARKYFIDRFAFY